jgi:uncharacterized protein (TIGR00251 family)
MRLQVKVIAGSSKTEPVGYLSDVLKIKVAAPADKNKANQALVKFFSDRLEVPQSSVIIIAGHNKPWKLIELPDNAELGKLLNELR